MRDAVTSDQHSIRQAYRRTGLVAAVTTIAVVTALVVRPGGAARSVTIVKSGTARATADVLSLAPTAGSLALSFGSGSVVAETVGGLAQALSETANLGLVGSSLTSEGCDGSDPTFTPDQLPQPTTVDNRKGDATAEDADFPIGNSQLGGGIKRVSAKVKPAAAAEATSLVFDFSPLLRVDGGRAEADVDTIDGDRDARSSIELSITIAGAVTLTGMEWSAHHRSGAKPVAEGAFSMGRISAAGTAIPFESVAEAETIVNGLLAPTGLRVELPRVDHQKEGVEAVRVRPLRLLLDRSPLGATLVRPALDITREARSELFTQLTALSCDFSSLFLVGEIGLGIAAGTGSLIAEIGGADAQSALVDLEDPFGDLDGFDEPLDVSGVDLDLPVGDGPGLIGNGALPGTDETITAGPREVALTGSGRTVRTCETTHPIGSPGCSAGAALAVGAIGFVATAGMAALDLRRRRRLPLGVDE